MASIGWQRTSSAFLIGLGIGAGLGILLAPKSGADTRDDITGALQDGVNSLRDGAAAVKGHVDDVVAQGAKLGRRAQRTVDDAKVQVNDATDAGVQAYRDAKASIS